jgi:hypothetical protein
MGTATPGYTTVSRRGRTGSVKRSGIGSSFSLDVVDAGKGSFSDRVNAPAFVDFPFLGTFNPPTSIARRLDERDA